MAEKGSKYARKHREEDAAAIGENQGQVPADNEVNDVFYDDITFIKTFLYLPYEDQIKAYQLLKQLMENSQDKAISKAARCKLKMIHEMAGIKREEMLRHPLSREEHHIIRMDCYGAVDKRPQHQLSSYYKSFLKKPLLRRLPPSFYDMGKAPSWQLFRQFQNFRNIEEKLRHYLSENNIDPDILSVMSVKDFSDLIYKTFKKDDNQMKAAFIQEGTDSERNIFVKTLARLHGYQIKQILSDMGIDQRYTLSLLNAMKMYGTTEADKIIITEIYFTRRVLDDLKKAKISCEEFREGCKIPQKLINSLIESGGGLLLAARNDKGERLTGRDFPSFEVHHKVAVSESGRFPNIAAVNYCNNFLLVSADIHKHVLHGYDKLQISNGKEAYLCRMEFDNPNVCFMAGFSKKHQIEHDWTNSIIYKRRMENDNCYLVSYEEVAAELQANRDKYWGKNKVDALRNNSRDNSEELDKLMKMVHGNMPSKFCDRPFKKGNGR